MMDNVAKKINGRFLFNSTNSDTNMVDRQSRPRNLNIWRPSSLINLVNPIKRQKVLRGSSSTDCIDSISSDGSPVINDDKSASVKERNKKGWNTIVTVVVVEAKDLPNLPANSSAHGLYCKISLGSEHCKSKPAPCSRQPEWRERLTLRLKKDNLLRVSLWDKGKQKNFMGSCVIDLASLEKERTHDIWRQLDDGFGSVHLNVTMCITRNTQTTPENTPNLDEVREIFALSNLKTEWHVVGQLFVRLIGARGLKSKTNTYCTLELDNERVQTHNARASSEPMWNKSYVFNVYDVTSTLDLKVQESSILNSLRNESLGKVSIPLLRIQNGEKRWFALKDRSKRNAAKGNCPRVLMEMSLIWNPVKASLKLFQPREARYIKKPPKFDLGLVYNNLIFIRDTFGFLYELNEGYKGLLEWENKEISSVALSVWLLFWFYFQIWMLPLLLLMPFLFYWIYQNNQAEISMFFTVCNEVQMVEEFGIVGSVLQRECDKGELSLPSKIQGLPEVTLKITQGVEYLASTAERIYNLVTFKVPFLSYLAIIYLLIASIGLYYIPINYFLMALGVYKYTRKQINPKRKPNNDLLDFISRIPDNEILQDWQELSVPEPNQQRSQTNNQNNFSDTQQVCRDIKEEGGIS